VRAAFRTVVPVVALLVAACGGTVQSDRLPGVSAGESLPRDVLAQLEWAFRLYIDDVLGVMHYTRLILSKAVEKGAVSDEPIEAEPPPI
jgi:hypothetical protein